MIDADATGDGHTRAATGGGGGDAAAHRVVRASAGAGKTYRLSLEYLRLLDRGAAPQSILATTFTRKAAGEILHRILARLVEAAGDAKAAETLGGELDDPQFHQAAAMALLRRTAEQMHRVRVSTLDRFFHELGQAFEYEIGLPVSARLLAEDDVEAAAMRDAAIAIMLQDEAPDVLMTMLRQTYHDAVHRGVSASLVKLVETLYAVYQDAPASAWEAIPVINLPSEAQVAEWVDALRQLGPAMETQKRMATAWMKDASQAAAGQWDLFLKGGLAAKVADGSLTFYRKPLPDEVVAVYQKVVDYAKAHRIAMLSRSIRGTRDLLERYDKAFRELRRRQGVVLLSDLPRMLRQLIDQGDDAADASAADGAGGIDSAAMFLDEAQARLGAGIDHLLLDEFQDTSLQQWSILRPLARQIREAPADAATPPPSIFCVGDVKQAIYRWRGGCAEIFDAFEADLSLPQTSSERLDVTYRCAPPVVEAVNRTFDELPLERFPEALIEAAATWADGFGEHTAVQTELAGYVELVHSPQPVDDDADDDRRRNDGDGDDDDGAGETKPVGEHDVYACELIAQLSDDHPGATVGVLVSTNRQVNTYVDLLRELGAPASGEGGATVDDDPAVEAILSAMQLADHPGDTAAAFHVAQSPLAAVIREGLAAPWCASASAETAEAGANGSTHAAKASAQPAEAEAFEAAAMSRAIRTAILERGYADVTAEWVSRLAGVSEARSVRRMEQLVRLAETFETTAELRPAAFVRFVRAQRVEEPTPSTIRVMTVYRAKGLEFDIVVLPELTRRMGDVGNDALVLRDKPSPTAPPTGLYPMGNEDLRKAVADELPQLQVAHKHERSERLADDLSALYVAMTRAKRALHMVVPFHAVERMNKKASSIIPADILLAQLGGLLQPTDDSDEVGAETLDDGGVRIFSLGESDWDATSSLSVEAAASTAAEASRAAVAGDDSGGASGGESKAWTAAERREWVASAAGVGATDKAAAPSSHDGGVHAPAHQPSLFDALLEVEDMDEQDGDRGGVTVEAKVKGGRGKGTGSAHDAASTAAPYEYAAALESLSLRGDRAKLRGQLIHAWYEAVDWLDPMDAAQGEPAREVLVEIAARETPTMRPSDVDEAMSVFRRQLARPVVREAMRRPELEPGQAVRLWREQSFSVLTEGKVLSGRFDRVELLIGEDGRPAGARIVDFKTDVLWSDAVLAERVELYRPQIAAYRGALARLTGLEPEVIGGVLLFVTGGRLVEV